MKAIKSFELLSKELFQSEIENINQKYIECEVLEQKQFFHNYLKLTLLLNNEINDDFIIKPIYNIKEGNKIKIETKDILFRTCDYKLHLEIMKIVKIKNTDSKITIKKNYTKFNSPFIYANSLSELSKVKYNLFASLPVKTNETESFSGFTNIFFIDINKEELLITFDRKKFKVEGQKIYLLEGFLFNYEEKKFIQLANSNIVEMNEVLKRNEIISKSNIKDLFNFKGKVKYFDFKQKLIKVENESNNNQYEIEINNKLFGDISLNCECNFFNFSKVNDNKYKYNCFSKIEYQQKTYIKVNFVDNLKDKYYDIIKCDNIIQDINANSIILELDDHSNKISEIKTITLAKKDKNNNIIEQKEFNFEVDNGKINNVDSLSAKTEGYSYQLYFESNNKDSLPKLYKIQVNNKIDIDIKPDYNENEFYERFTIINVPYQKIQENEKNALNDFSLNGENIQDNEKSFKYLFTINNNTTKIHKFKLKKHENYQSFYNKYDKYEKDLQTFFESYFPKQIDLLHRDINYIESEKNECIKNLFSNENLLSDLKDIITKGFNKYYFKNCRQDYILMRNICFAFICLRIKAKKYDIIDFNLIFSTFKGLLIKLNFEYIDRIKALIAITREFEYQKYDYTKLGLDIVKSTSKNKEFSYYTKAMSIFLNIINDLTENCAFYKGIRQFNGIILEDEFSQKDMYSGSLINIKDIQIELFKNVGRFCIFQKGIINEYGSYWSYARTMFLNPDTILGKYNKTQNLKENILKRATACTLFVIFHELTGHMKTHINSENDSPDQAYINDFNLQLVKMDSPDSGYLFEFIMAGNFISCKYFINSSISENLLDEKLYLGDNFNELREKLQKMENVLSPMSVTKKPNNEKKSKDINEIIDDINLNYDKMTINELFIFFSSLSKEKKAEIENSDAYQYFASFYNKNGKKI